MQKPGGLQNGGISKTNGKDEIQEPKVRRKKVKEIDTESLLEDLLLSKDKNKEQSNARNPTLNKFIKADIKGRAYAYIRVSTQMQRNQGFSLDNQKERIKRFVEANNYDLIYTFEDPGISGKHMRNRKGFVGLLSVLEPHDTVIVLSVSRIGRNSLEVKQIANIFEKYNIQIISLDGAFDLKTANGKFIFALSNEVAEVERNLTAERVSSVMQYLSEIGELRHKPRFGYKIITLDEEKTKEVVEDEEEQKVISYMREFVKQNPEITVSGLCRILDKQGIKFRTSEKAHYNNINNILRDNNIELRRRSPIDKINDRKEFLNKPLMTIA